MRMSAQADKKICFKEKTPARGLRWGFLKWKEEERKWLHLTPPAFSNSLVLLLFR